MDTRRHDGRDLQLGLGLTQALGSVQFSSGSLWYLCAREGPYALHPVSFRFSLGLVLDGVFLIKWSWCVFLVVVKWFLLVKRRPGRSLDRYNCNIHRLLAALSCKLPLRRRRLVARIKDAAIEFLFLFFIFYEHTKRRQGVHTVEMQARKCHPSLDRGLSPSLAR